MFVCLFVIFVHCCCSGWLYDFFSSVSVSSSAAAVVGLSVADYINSDVHECVCVFSCFPWFRCWIAIKMICVYFRLYKCKCICSGWWCCCCRCCCLFVGSYNDKRDNKPKRHWVQQPQPNIYIVKISINDLQLRVVHSLALFLNKKREK